MRRHGGTVAWLIGVGLIAALWLSFAPTQLGGSTSYAVTEGVSMLPEMHGGTLAVVRPKSSYHVGEVALYRSPVLNRPVLHRIIAIKAGRDYFKGDNNNFVDPGSVTKSAIVGALWFHVPRVGGWIGWMAKPFHAALLGAVAALVLLLGGTAQHRRRKRRRVPAEGPVRDATPSPGRSPAEGPVRDATPSPGRSHARLTHDVSGWWVALAGVVVLAVALAVVGFNKPLKQTISSPGAYRNLGGFSYAGKLAHPNTAYPSGYALTGQPLLLNLVHTLQVRFRYAFSSRLPHQIQGTISLAARLEAQNGYHRTFTLVQPIAFKGDRTSASGTVSLVAARAFVDQLSAQSGAVGVDYNVDLTPIVRITGFVGDKSLHETFEPVLPFTLNSELLAVQVPAPPIGASYTADTATGLTTILNPDQPGSVPRSAPNALSFAHVHLAVQRVRILGIALFAIALLGLLPLGLVQRRRHARSEPDVIQAQYGHLIIPALTVNPDGQTAVELPDFRSLARLAQHYEHLILHEHHGVENTYAVEESGRLYTYRSDAVAQTQPAPAIPPAAVHTSHDIHPGRWLRTGRRKLLRPLGLLVVLAVSATLITSFTAGNTVPVTYAGTSNKTVTVSQLAPSQCSSLALTTLIVIPVNGSSATGTSKNELILGRSYNGTVTYNAGAGDDCIVAGGNHSTTNNINGGGGTDVCIGGINATNNFSNCDKTYN